MLTPEQVTVLINHLEIHTYFKASEICDYVKRTWNVEFSVSGMTQWLHHNKFSYKKPQGIPAKADAQKQVEFIKYYEGLLNTLPEDEPVEFGEGFIQQWRHK